MRVKTKPLTANDPIPLTHSVIQAATRLGVGKSTLYELIDAKEIKAFKVGVRTLVPEAELRRYIKSKLSEVH